MLGFNLLDNKTSVYHTKHNVKKELDDGSSSDEEFTKVKGGKNDSKHDLNLSYKSVL